MAVQGYKARPPGWWRLARAKTQGQVSRGWHPQPVLKPGPTLALPLRYPISPHPHQERALARMCGCGRVIRNDAWTRCRSLHRQGETDPGSAALRKRCITQARHATARQWLGGVSASMLQQSVPELDQAFRKWWKGNGKVGTPRFKQRSRARSIRSRGQEFRTTDHGGRFPKVGELKLRWNRSSPAPPTSLTIIKDTRGRYCASFAIGVEEQPLPANTTTIGADPGWASLAVTSARAIADAGWRMVQSLLEYRTRLYGREVGVISRWEPTSRTCSACGHREGKKPLSVRTRTCSACGAEQIRGLNAAGNILATRRAARLNGCGVESRTGLPASGNEASTRLHREANHTS